MGAAVIPNTPVKQMKTIWSKSRWVLIPLAVFAFLALAQGALRELRIACWPEAYVDEAIRRSGYPTACRENMKSCSFARGSFFSRRYLDLRFEDESMSVDITAEVNWLGLGEKWTSQAESPPVPALPRQHKLEL